MTVSEAELDEMGEQYNCSPHIIRPREIRAAASRGQAFLVEGAIPAGGVTFIAGKPGAKKSWLAYDLMLAVARGEEWLGYGPAVSGPVLLLNYDNPLDLMARRLVQLNMRDDDAIHVHSNARDPWKMPAKFDHVVAITRVLKPRLIVVDSFRQSSTLDENSSKDMGQLMDLFKSLTVGGTAVVVIHHLAKGGDPLRGSGEIEASADAVIVVSSVKKGLHEHTDQAHWEKHRGWEPTEEMRLDFEVVDVGDRTTVRRKAA